MIKILSPWFVSIGVLLASATLGFGFQVFLLRRLKILFEKTETKIDDILIDILGRHLAWWFVLGGLAAAAQVSPLTETHRGFIHKIAVSALILLVSLAASSLLSQIVKIYSTRFLASAALAGLVDKLVRIAVLGTGAMILLSNMGISIAPLITALGVSSLAVALALQDTLANLFSGMHIIASRMIEVGDYIKLDSGQEGIVEDIGWRTTRIKELANNEVLVPNAKLAQAIIINYQNPDPEMAAPVPMGVSYDCDLKKVEKVTLEVAREVQSLAEGAVRNFEPLIRYNAFADSSVNFNVVLRCRQFTDRGLVIHEFIKRVHERYQREGIEIPFPQRVVLLKKNSS